jgi:NADH:ubiquinone oxidoreductase subunit K
VAFSRFVSCAAVVAVVAALAVAAEAAVGFGLVVTAVEPSRGHLESSQDHR